jgi:hypothetical protein
VSSRGATAAAAAAAAVPPPPRPVAATPPQTSRHRSDLAPAVGAAVPTRALLDAGDHAGLLPFGAPHPPPPASLALPATATPPPPATGAPASDTARRDTRAPAPRDSDGQSPTPPAPPGSPGNAGAGGVASAAGGAASGVWCAILLAGIVFLAPQLRRHRVRLVIPAPRGVEFLLHRPG